MVVMYVLLGYLRVHCFMTCVVRQCKSGLFHEHTDGSMFYAGDMYCCGLREVHLRLFSFLVQTLSLSRETPLRSTRPIVAS